MGMMKKFINIILIFILVFCIITHVVAAEQNVVLSLGRIGVTMPEISVEIKGSGYDKSTISSTLDSEKLSVEDVYEYDSDKHSTCVYILVDLSTSMYDSFDLVKSNIVSYIERLKDKDKVVLITFGEENVNVTLNGSETRSDAIDAVNELECDESGTLFYEAINQAYQLSNSSTNNFDREFVIAFSDGIDFQKGSSTFEEVKKLYSSRALPLYAACSETTSKDASDKFGELTRVSGGCFSIIDSEDSFDDFIEQLNDVTIVKLKAASNYADGKEKLLSIKVGTSQIEVNIPIVRSMSDTTAPKVDKLVYDIEKDVFVISFSERVIGATYTNAYKITNARGKKIEVSDVFYSEKDDTYEIKTNTPITKGVYTFEFSGIKDDSKEANVLSETQKVEVEKTKNSFGIPPWAVIVIVAGIVLAISLVGFIFALSSKKRNGESNADDVFEIPVKKQKSEFEYDEPVQDVVKHHIKTNDAIRIRLKIQTGKTSEQNIETNIVSSLIIGRSETCDIYIDDTKLSRQHFAIENDNGIIYVMDLQSRNGTMLNGIRINSRQRLSSGDKIMAGLSDVFITILGR